MKLTGKTIAVTGGGDGIGRQLVLALLARGARVAAIDLRQDALDETAQLAKAGDKLSLHGANIADRQAVLALPDRVIAHHGAVDGIINNAGVIQPFTPFSELGFEAIDRMIAVNLGGTINMVKAFLPRLTARPEAHIANVASMGGFLPFPGQSLYGASKAGVKLLTEALYAELLDTPVGVSVVMPGAVNTAITENSGVKPLAGAPAGDKANAALSAPEAARIILDGIEADRLHILVGKDARLLWTLSRIAPRWSIGVIQKQMKAMSARAKGR